MRHLGRRHGRGRLALMAVMIALAIPVGLGTWLWGGGVRSAEAPATRDAETLPASARHTPPNRVATRLVNAEAGATPEAITFPRASWPAASIRVEPSQAATLSQVVELTGKITFNEDHVAHIFPLVEGRVDEVKIQFGDEVQEGQLLVVVQSKEVGQAMLRLFQDRLQRDFALTKDRWTQSVNENTQAMIELIRDDVPIDTIQEQLRNRPMGEYRDTLMTAYISYYKAKQHYERLAPLSQQGAVPRKQTLEAEAELKATEATLQSLVEQIHQDARQASIVSGHTVRELQTRVSVGEANLKILGFTEDQLADIDPARQGEAISHYPVHSPFDGTVVSKDVVLLERVAPDRQILSIADLSTVWVTTDVYEEQLPLLQEMEGRTIQLRSDAWPDKTFEAEIFYTGDVVNESTRTISMRAVADNEHRLLKPGMFVNVEFPIASDAPVVQIPRTAIQEHQGRTFVFVHRGGDRFEPRDVVLGRRNSDMVEVTSGLEAGESVAVDGGFALKSRMLAELLSE